MKFQYEEEDDFTITTLSNDNLIAIAFCLEEITKLNKKGYADLDQKLTKEIEDSLTKVKKLMSYSMLSRGIANNYMPV